MISVAGYKQLQLIHQGLHNLVYTGIRTKDKSKVILRQLRPELASPQLVSRHRKEFELLSVIKSDHVITPIELIETRDSPILVTEHPEGVPLIDFMDAGNISTQEAAKIGCLIARAIEDLHSYDIVHKDINPANIVYDRDSVSIKLIDFGISTSVSPNQIKAEVNRTLEGTLNYLSPEQTGRMNRSVDFRSDFYSLGVTLYQLLTGQLPFESEDSLELIYQHMTRQPMPLTSIKPDIPKALSKITLKLLSKMPEDRYQSAFAIIRDLDRVLDLMTENGHTDVDFEVALDDISEQLNISERLLERESQLIDLLNALDQTSSGESAAIFCIGENGIGKSSLVRELEREVISRGGYLGKGTYNPITTEVPYTAVSAAINDLVKQLLGQPDFPARKALIQKKLAGLEEPMFSLAPELRNIIEYVPSQKPVAPSEAKPKLVRGIIALLNTICDGKTPLVISLDNLQWIDSASIDLFEDLFSRNQLPYVMLVGAYRTFALDQSDPNRVRIQKLLDLNLNIQLLNLQPLSQEGVNRLVAESLFRSEDETNEFAKIIHEKTNGIPLAVKEFLNRIHEKEYLRFDRVHREWTWNMQSITSESPSDNVSLTLVHQLQNLDSTTVRLLQIASSIGIEFDLELLQMVSGLSFSETSTRLSVAIQQGYLLQLANQDGIRDKRIFFRFSNERIQQTVYEMIEQKDRRQIHASIGKAILQTTRGDVGNRIFDIVNQLNNSFEVPDKSGIDQRQLAELNITAGHRAKNAAAFQQAFKYFRTAIALLGQNAWVQYDRSLEIHLDAANVAYLCGDEHQLDLLINNILDHARTPTDTAKAVEIKVRSLIAATKLGDAIDTSLSALESLDIVLTKPARIKTAITAGEVLWRSWRLSTQEEIELPPMTDDRHLAAMKLLLILCQASYMAGDSRIGRYVLEMAHISLRHGLAPESSFVFPALGALFISRFGTIDFGYRLGRMAINNLRDDDKSLHCKTLLLAHNFNFSWKDHLYRTLEPLARAHQIGLENDDIEFALIAATTASANAFVLGHDLNSIQNSLIEHTTEAKHHQQTPIYYLGAIYLQACRNLTDSVNAPWLLEGESFSEDELLQHQELKVDDSALANLFVVKLYLATLFNRYEIAREFADQVRVHINAIEASPAIPVFYVFETLACIKTLSTQNFIGKLKLHLRIWRNRRKLRKWAHHAPENIQHRYHLIEAELAAYRGQQLQAMQHYELAINNAQKNRYLNDLALINELAGRFYLANNKKDLADYYINNAAKYFKRWGANNKVSLLQSQFSDLSNQTLGSQPTPVTGFLYGSDKSLLDLETVIKASQVLVGEVVLENLLERLMQVVLVNAGGHKASLILNTDNVLSVEITTWVTEGDTQYRFESVPIEQSTEIPVSVVQYVSRTREDLVLNNAVSEDIFTLDEYILREQPKSVLCVPILSQTHLTGILYIENTYSTHAFTQDRVSVLKLLAAQSAIAIENSRLYQQLNDSRNKYLSLYQNAVEGIFEMDDSGAITNINPAAAALLGYDTPDKLKSVVASSIRSAFVDPNDFDEFRGRLIKSGRVMSFDTQVVTRSGEPIWVSLSGKIIHDTANDKYKLEGSIVNVTERKLREEAEQATLIAESATATKSQFLANMSHEIRTPMNAIIGYTNLTLSTELSTEQSEYLNTIRNASNHLLRVVNDILDLSRVESGKLELEQNVFYLSKVFQDLSNLFGLAAKDKGLQLNLPEIDVESETSYLGDPIRLGQVLINLVGNALKFTEQGSITVTWSEENLTQDKTRLTFRVKDSGIGIEESELESIFESFSQGNNTPSDTGTGLGLSISRKLAEMMGGELVANSKSDQGSTFYFTAIVERQLITTSPAIPTFKEPASRASKPEILLVEDNEINQNLAKRVLEQRGYTITVAEHGAAALEILKHRFFPVILMDIKMPVMDGLEAIRQIRADPSLQSAVVIALSAGVLDVEVDEAMAAGFDDYLPKPIDFDALTEMLGEITGGETFAIKPQDDFYVRGVNFGNAINSHGGDVQFLITLTSDFIDIYGNAASQIAGFLAERDFEQAERLIHNIAGISGTFGAEDLMETCRKVEREIREGAQVSESNHEEFRVELENFISAIREFQSSNENSHAGDRVL